MELGLLPGSCYSKQYCTEFIVWCLEQCLTTESAECCWYLVAVISDFWTPWTVAHQASLSLRFPRQEHWSGLPFSSPRAVPGAGIECATAALAETFCTTEPPGKPRLNKYKLLLHVITRLLCACRYCVSAG